MKRKVLYKKIKEKCKALKERMGFLGIWFMPWTNGISILTLDDERKEVRRIKYFRYPEYALAYVSNYRKEAKHGKEKSKQSIL